MEVDETTPERKSDALKQMPYSELKKLAVKHGIKGNMKAEKIIAALCSLNSDDLESFSTPAQKEINSSRKNKEKKFDEDMMTPLATPRRGTYSVESPTSVKAEESLVVPAACETPALDVSNVTVERGSERKLRRKVSFLSPMAAQSTPKNSSIKLRPKTPIASRTSLGKRVSFSSPAREQKNRSSERSLRLTPHPRKSSEKSFHITPRLRNSFTDDSSVLSAGTPKKSIGLPSVTELPEKQDVTPIVKKFKDDGKSILKSDDASEVDVEVPISELPQRQQRMTRSIQQSQKDVNKSIVKSDDAPDVDVEIPIPELPQRQQRITRSIQQSQKNVNKSSSSVLCESKSEASAKKKRGATPNFKKIHEKAFEKMESIDDYQKRKVQNSEKKINHRPNLKSKVTKAKSKIPGFSGIPFIPSVSSSVCKTLTFDIKPKKVDPVVETKKVRNVNENAQKKDKSKFDLKKSLSRKLSYVPYKGPLKPLAGSNILNTTTTSCLHNQKPVKEPINKVVNSNRSQTRSILKGVRTNKRFELQMKNRNLK